MRTQTHLDNVDAKICPLIFNHANNMVSTVKIKLSSLTADQDMTDKTNRNTVQPKIQ